LIVEYTIMKLLHIFYHHTINIQEYHGCWDWSVIKWKVITCRLLLVNFPVDLNETKKKMNRQIWLFGWPEQPNIQLFGYWGDPNNQIFSYLVIWVTRITKFSSMGHPNSPECTQI
jgi:hypothetical protein